MTQLRWDVKLVTLNLVRLLRSLDPPYRIINPCRHCGNPTHFDDNLCGACFTHTHPGYFRNHQEPACTCGARAILFVELGTNYHKEIVGFCLECYAEELKTLALMQRLNLDLVREIQT